MREQLQQGLQPQQTLEAVYTVLAQHSREIRACNMGLSDGTGYWVWHGNPSGKTYYQLYHAQHDTLRMTCSAPFGAWAWQG